METRWWGKGSGTRLEWNAPGEAGARRGCSRHWDGPSSLEFDLDSGKSETSLEEKLGGA